MPPQMIPESPSMGSVQIINTTTTSTQIQLQQQQQQQKYEQAPSQAQPAIPAKATDYAQDNSITSEPSETTTTTTTTSEDVVTTYKEPSQKDSISLYNGSGGAGKAAGSSGDKDTAAANTFADISEQISEDKVNEDNETPPLIDDGARGDSADNSQALDSEDSAVQRELKKAAAAVAIAAVHGYPRPSLKVESSDVYQIVDVIRRNTNLSFDLSCEALRVVLTSLEQLYNGAINPYLEAVAIHVTQKVDTPKELLGLTHDSKRLQYIFSQLADCKNDSEQRTWMLYEDEDDIITFLEELVEILVYECQFYNYFS